MKKYILIFLLLLCTGCLKSNPEEVKLCSKSEALEKVENKFGEAEYVDQAKGNHSITYTFKDKKYGFEYHFTCEARSEGMDGTTFGYTQGYKDDYDDRYQEYLEKENK